MDYSEGPQLSADAKTIVYVSDRAESGNRDIWVQSLPDGIPKRITTDPATDEDPSISPDGRLVAFESSRTPRGIYLADVEHGGEKLIAADGRGATFSPDGRSLLYSTGDEYRVEPSGKLYLYDLETGKSVQLASDMKDARNAVWNSDGDHILFVGCASLVRPYPSCKDWWITTREGARPRPTGALPALLSQKIRPIVYFGGWHGNSLLFSAERAGSFGLWELKIDPDKGTVSGPPKEPISSDHRNFIISSSLVGKTLAISQLNPDVHVWRIEHAANPEGATATKVTDDPDYDYDPGISRNGRWLVFVRGYSDARKIYLQDTQSGINGPLPFRHSSKAWPIIDDAGTKIAYEAAEGNASGIWIGSLDGRDRKLCTDCRNPTGWFGQEDAVLHGNSALSEVSMTPTAGGPTRTILKMPGGTVQDAVWSPESRFLLFTVLKPGSDGQIYTARFLPGEDAPSSHWVPITAETSPSRTPRWSGDGKTIFYLSKADGFWCVWGQHFDPVLGRTIGSPFTVRHFHDFKFSPDGLSAETFNIAVTGDSLYLNVLQTRGTIWLGELSRKSLFSFSP
jgi:Tol biopolymer transport system component